MIKGDLRDLEDMDKQRFDTGKNLKGQIVLNERKQPKDDELSLIVLYCKIFRVIADSLKEVTNDKKIKFITLTYY